MPGVFHPGFFYSTKFLLKHLETKNLKAKSLLELGCGTGLISVYAALTGAKVTALDISPTAVENTKRNASTNKVAIVVVESDLFDRIDGRFDIIIINPPYYNRDPRSESEHAWYTGDDHRYFRKLFFQLPAHTHEATETWMVLTKGCDLEAIHAIAAENDISLELLKEKRMMFDERDYLYRLRPANSSFQRPA